MEHVAAAAPLRGRVTPVFAALRFTADPNLSERTYWYLCEFEVAAGDFVFAPVGPRNRVQRAEVVRVCKETEGGVPYDPALCKYVAAKYGDRERRAGGYLCYEMGGIAIDERHYTAFGRVLLSPEVPPSESVLRDLRAERLIVASCGGEGEALTRLAEGGGCALLCGEGAKSAAALLISLVRGDSKKIRGILSSETVAALQTLLDYPTGETR